MQLTRQTDYAFRLLMYLACLPKDERANIQQICKFYDISSNHVAKVVVKLAKLGYITAFRGKGGGLILARDPARIRLDEVVKDFETSLKPVNCKTPMCAIIAGCQLKAILSDGMQQFLSTLSQHTLADITDKRLAQVVTVR
jgi:Rrf2 family nitric oxide-sensitive transcriptional repressor